MPETEKAHKDNHRIIIYHGHIHLLSKNDETEDREDLSEYRNPEL